MGLPQEPACLQASEGRPFLLPNPPKNAVVVLQFVRIKKPRPTNFTWTFEIITMDDRSRKTLDNDAAI